MVLRLAVQTVQLGTASLLSDFIAFVQMRISYGLVAFVRQGEHKVLNFHYNLTEKFPNLMTSSK